MSGSFNWRGSIDLPRCPGRSTTSPATTSPRSCSTSWPQTGAATVKVVAHCQGAAAISMAAVAGLVPEVDTVVVNGVSLHPLVPPASRRSSCTSCGRCCGRGEPYVDVAWGDGPERGVPWLARNAVRLAHVECGNPSCNMASFALGAGHPALWRHENLTTPPTTGSARVRQDPDELVRADGDERSGRQNVSVRPHTELPRDGAATAPRPRRASSSSRATATGHSCPPARRRPTTISSGTSPAANAPRHPGLRARRRLPRPPCASSTSSRSILDRARR